MSPILLLLAIVPTDDPFMVSPADQVKLGLQAAAELRAKEKVLPDKDPRVVLVRKIGAQLLKGVDDKGLPWKYSFDVIDSKTVNAFALPGGPTFVYTGLLAKIDTVDEVAGVMGHELTHVRRQHFARQRADSIKRELGLALLLGLTKASKDLGDIANIANSAILGTKYSRGHETEADDGGFDLMTAAGYNPQGLADVFSMLGKLGSQAPEFLSTHPNDKNRVKRIEDRIRKSGRTYPALTPLRLGIR